MERCVVRVRTAQIDASMQLPRQVGRFGETGDCTLCFNIPRASDAELVFNVVLPWFVDPPVLEPVRSRHLIEDPRLCAALEKRFRDGDRWYKVDWFVEAADDEDRVYRCAKEQLYRRGR